MTNAAKLPTAKKANGGCNYFSAQVLVARGGQCVAGARSSWAFLAAVEQQLAALAPPVTTWKRPTQGEKVADAEAGRRRRRAAAAAAAAEEEEEERVSGAGVSEGRRGRESHADGHGGG